MLTAFIGTGTMARTYARHLLAAGHQVMLCNSRGPESLSDLVAELGPGASAGTKADALEADLVVLAVNWLQVDKALEGLVWDGQILVDAVNAHMELPPDISLEGVTRSRAALGGRTSSEMVAERAPGARLVKSMCNVPVEWISEVGADKPRTVIFVSGDDPAAKRVVVDLLDEVGFAAVDLGDLATGGALHEVGAPLSGQEFHYVKSMR